MTRQINSSHSLIIVNFNYKEVALHCKACYITVHKYHHEERRAHLTSCKTLYLSLKISVSAISNATPSQKTFLATMGPPAKHHLKWPFAGLPMVAFDTFM